MNTNKLWTREACVAAIATWYARTGHPPKWFEWKKAGRGHPCMNTLLRTFGSLEKAIIAAGLEPEMRIDAWWTKSRIADAMLDHMATHGRWPSQWAWNLSGGKTHPPAATVRYVFGSWAAAVSFARGDERRRYVDGEPVADALRDYIGSDGSARAVAELLGIDVSPLLRLLSGKRPRIEQDAADRILTTIDRPDVLAGLATA